MIVPVYITNSFSAAAEVAHLMNQSQLCSKVWSNLHNTEHSSLSGINHHAEKFQFAFVKFVLSKNNSGVAVNSDIFPSNN